jgi:DNA-binding SARP family transcriptional activator
LREDRAGALEQWEWFAPAVQRMNDLRTMIAHRLASDALERGDPDAALAYASDVISYDPCDEPAREMVIRAHLALGDRAAALRTYRQYRDVLKSELQVEPSATLSALVAGS